MSLFASCYSCSEASTAAAAAVAVVAVVAVLAVVATHCLQIHHVITLRHEAKQLISEK